MRHDRNLLKRIGCGYLSIQTVRDYRNQTGSKITREAVASHLRGCKSCRDAEKEVSNTTTKLRQH